MINGIRWVYYKAPLLIGFALTIYALWYTEAALAPFAHERRVKEIDRLLMLGLLDTESGQRGYLLTGDPIFLNQYRVGAGIVSKFRPIYREVLLSERSQELFGEFDRTLQLKLDEMGLTIKLHDEARQEAALKIVRNKEGFGYTAKINELRLEIRQDEGGFSRPLESLRLPSDFSVWRLQ